MSVGGTHDRIDTNNNDEYDDDYDDDGASDTGHSVTVAEL